MKRSSCQKAPKNGSGDRRGPSESSFSTLASSSKHHCATLYFGWPNHRGCTWRPSKTAYLERELRRHFRDSWVTGFEPLIRKMTNDEKDRHVLAAAVRAGAQTIVTFNKRHLPPASTSRWDVEAVGPAAFLEDLYLEAPAVVTERIQQQATNLGRSLARQLEVLAAAVPSFVDIFRRNLARKGDRITYASSDRTGALPTSRNRTYSRFWPYNRNSMTEYIEMRDGGYYVAGARVSLDSLVYAFRGGASPETIQQQFPSLSLEHVYGAIAFYLGHQEDVDANIREGEEQVKQLVPSLGQRNPEAFARLLRAREQRPHGL